MDTVKNTIINADLNIKRGMSKLKKHINKTNKTQHRAKIKLRLSRVNGLNRSSA